MSETNSLPPAGELEPSDEQITALLTARYGDGNVRAERAKVPQMLLWQSIEEQARRDATAVLRAGAGASAPPGDPA